MHAPSATSRAPSPSESANFSARLLLAELLPQRSDSSSGSGGAGVGGNNNSGTAAATLAAAAAKGWTGGAGGQRWSRANAAATGTWCSGLEFDRASGPRRPGGE